MCNQEVLDLTCKTRYLLPSIRKRQIEFLGHVLRKEKLEALSLRSKIPAKRARGRQRYMYLEQFHKSPSEILHMAHDRRQWKLIKHEAIDNCYQF